MPTPSFSTMSQTRSMSLGSAMCCSPCRRENVAPAAESGSRFWQSAQAFLYVARRSHAERSFWGGFDDLHPRLLRSAARAAAQRPALRRFDSCGAVRLRLRFRCCGWCRRRTPSSRSSSETRKHDVEPRHGRRRSARLSISGACCRKRDGPRQRRDERSAMIGRAGDPATSRRPGRRSVAAGLLSRTRPYYIVAYTCRSTIFLDLGDRLRRIEALRAGLGAVHDGVAAVEPERVFEIVEPLAGRLVAAVADPAVGLQQRGRAEIALRVPPVARARRRAAGAQDALVVAVELLRGPRGSASIPSPASASWSAATARSRRIARRNSSGPAPGPSPPACAAADRLCTVPLISSMPLVQASVLVPSMFMAQEPQTPSRQERRNVSVGSILFLIQISASRTIGAQSSRSTK